MSETTLKPTNNKKPIIFSDVDGTIYENFNLLDATLNDIHFAVKNGADFNICTGNVIEERMYNLAKQLKSKFIIGSSGAQIYDRDLGKIIKSWKISFDSLKKIIALVKDQKYQMIFWDNEKYFYLFDHPKSVKIICSYHFSTPERLQKIPKLYQGEYIEPVKIELYSLTNYETEAGANEIYERIKNVENVTIVPTACNVEISAKNITKWSAIEWLMKNNYIETKIEDIMTIGDSNNDFTMLQHTQYSYAMANSSAKILDIAHFFTSSVEQNGLGEAILDYLYRLKNIVKKYMLHEFQNQRNNSNE
ncbi:HAD-IIB family hydrolase [Metamycoplasma equirhinis]|uniref:HAD-IIB family hydrolase n=1 Tax=Metamycoplasma equirhinis TaxID=92402 RepID=UPI0035942B7F